MKTLLVALILLIFSSDLLAKEFVAEVIKIRGKVTQLRSGSMIASKLKVGDKLTADTSVVTGKKSFARVKFIDASVLNIGPKSMVVINQMERKRAGVISLLKGTLRATVKKSRKKTKKTFFVKTRSSALGIRGTDFQVIYNAENNISSLITYDGEVAMSKIDSSFSNTEKIKQRIRIKRKKRKRGKGRVKSAKSKWVDRIITLDERLDQITETKDIVVVKKGQFSGVSHLQRKISKPVKISPHQFAALSNNSELAPKRENRDIKYDAKAIKLKDQAAQSVPVEGFYNAVTGDYAPKAGGFIDISSGLYIPPSDKSKFNQKLGVFMPANVGTIDSASGDYVPPKGIILSATEGFIINKSLPQKKRDLLVAKQKLLNRTMGKERILVGDVNPNMIDGKWRPLSNRELMAKNVLTFSLMTFSQELKSTDSANGDKTYEAPSGKHFHLEWLHSSGENWQPVIEFGVKMVDYETGQYGNVIQLSDKLVTMLLAGRYHFTNSFFAQAGVSLDQEHYLEYTTSGSSNQEMTRVTVPKVEFLIGSNIFKTNRFIFSGKLGLFYTKEKSAADLTVNSGSGMKFSLNAKYWTSRSTNLNLGLWHQNEKQDVTKSNVTYENDRNLGGLLLSFGITI